MQRLTWQCVAWVGLVGVVGVACLSGRTASAAAPSEADVQGLYEGTCKDAKGQQQIEARVVAWGHGAFKVFVRQALGEGKVAKITLDSKVEGDAVRFTGKAGDAEWTASYADGEIRGTCGPNATLELKRVVRESPTLGAKPPQGAVVLLDGKTFDEMTRPSLKDKTEQPWKITEGGAIEVPKGGMNSKQQFAGSLKLHVEMKIPLRSEARGQGRGNSGVYLPNGDEIQVLDSFGMTTYKGGGCGGLYAYKDPDLFDEFSLASLPPLQWQTYDVEYRVRQVDGKPVGKPRVTVVHNGIKIHDNAELHNDARKGGFHFQDHGNPVEYRNIWVLPLEDK
jgi:hypothetical protein